MCTSSFPLEAFQYKHGSPCLIHYPPTRTFCAHRCACPSWPQGSGNLVLIPPFFRIASCSPPRLCTHRTETYLHRYLRHLCPPSHRPGAPGQHDDIACHVLFFTTSLLLRYRRHHGHIGSREPGDIATSMITSSVFLGPVLGPVVSAICEFFSILFFIFR
jgi:hypothetical protein